MEKGALKKKNENLEFKQKNPERRRLSLYR